MLCLNKTSLLLVVVMLGSFASARVDATSVSIPNGDFETIYKPGSTTITGQFNNDYTNGIGPNVTLALSSGASFSDSTSGNNVAIPGWVGTGVIAKFPASYFATYDYASTAGTNNSVLSAASLGTISAGATYDLSANIASEPGPSPPATSVILLRLFDATTNTPIVPSSTSYPALTGTSGSFTTPVLYTSSYDVATLASHVGNQLKIQIGKVTSTDPQIHFDNLALTFNPVPEPTAISLALIGGLIALRAKNRRRPV
jgi:hypothetical protein